MDDDPLTRPIAGIENRTPQEVFEIMCDRIQRMVVDRVRLPTRSSSERHIHKPTEFGGENCECGLNWRDEIHLSVGETA